MSYCPNKPVHDIDKLLFCGFEIPMTKTTTKTKSLTTTTTITTETMRRRRRVCLEKVES